MQLIIGVENFTLTDHDKRRLQHPAVSGVILFTRNYKDIEQLRNLTTSIREINPQLLISVDHEGGRVQRFRDGFTHLPPAHAILEHYKKDPAVGLSFSESCGFVMAIELQQVGVDLSYAPVLDLDFSVSAVIGDRSFGSLTQDVTALTRALMQGMALGGMANVGKHFPGHGGVEADSHGEIAIDHRSLHYLWNADIVPYRELIAGTSVVDALVDTASTKASIKATLPLKAIMPAHVIYPQVDDKPAGFSKIWIKDILREQLGFKGAVITDDLDMSGSDAVGDLSKKLYLANEAGCDYSLICNNFAAMDEALTLAHTYFSQPTHDMTQLFGKYRNQVPATVLADLPAHQAKIKALS